MQCDTRILGSYILQYHSAITVIHFCILNAFSLDHIESDQLENANSMNLLICLKRSGQYTELSVFMFLLVPYTFLGKCYNSWGFVCRNQGSLSSVWFDRLMSSCPLAVLR